MSRKNLCNAQNEWRRRFSGARIRSRTMPGHHTDRFIGPKRFRQGHETIMCLMYKEFSDSSRNRFNECETISPMFGREHRIRRPAPEVVSPFGFARRAAPALSSSFRPKPRIYPGEVEKSFACGAGSEALYRKDFSAPRPLRAVPVEMTSGNTGPSSGTERQTETRPRRRPALRYGNPTQQRDQPARSPSSSSALRSSATKSGRP